MIRNTGKMGEQKLIRHWWNNGLPCLRAKQQVVIESSDENFEPIFSAAKEGICNEIIRGGAAVTVCENDEDAL